MGVRRGKQFGLCFGISKFYCSTHVGCAAGDTYGVSSDIGDIHKIGETMIPANTIDVIIIVQSVQIIVLCAIAVRLFRAQKKISPAVVPASGASITPSVPIPPVTFAATTAAAHVECVTCHRTVARFTLTDKGPVCANCQPLK